MEREAPRILEELDMNAEIGAYQNDDDQQNDPIVEEEGERD